MLLRSCGRAGADDFLPVFIYVVLRANVPRLVSNIDYIARFMSSDDMMSQCVPRRGAARVHTRLLPPQSWVLLCEFEVRAAFLEKPYGA